MHPLNARMQCIMKLELCDVSTSNDSCCGFDVRSFVELLPLLHA
jgi:hypothetical protein